MKRLILCASILAIAALAVTVAPSAGAQASDWKQIPISPLKPFHPQEPKRIELPNGMVIFLQEDHELPLIDGIVRIRGGSRDEPANLTGMMDIYGEVWRTGGTKTQTGDQLDDFLEARAAKVETDVNIDSTTVSWSCLKGDFDDVFKVFADLLHQPEFRQDKIELAKGEMADSISRRNDDAGEIANREAIKLAYGAHNPYARDAEYATVAAVTRENLLAWYSRYVQPNNMILGVVGDFDSAAMEARLRAAFSDWPKGPAAEKSNIDFHPAKPGFYLIPKDDVNQSNIQMVALGTTRDNPDYYALQVFNEAFGGGFSSRLFKSIRTAQGLAYSVGGSVGTRFDHPGILRLDLATKSASTVESIHSMFEQIDEVKTKPMGDAEIKRAKDSILNSFVFNFDSRDKVLRERMAYEFYGYPADFLERYQAGVEKVTPADVARVAEKYLHKDDLAVLVVGNTSEFDKPLDSLGNVEKVDITIPPPPGQAQSSDAAPPAASNDEGKALAKKLAVALGGEALLQSIKSLQASYTITQKTPQGDLPLTMQSIILFPDHLHVTAQGPMGEFTVVATPDAAFISAGGMGVRDMPPSQRDETLAQIKRDLVYVGQHASDPAFIFFAAGPDKVGDVSVEALDVSGAGVSTRYLVDPTTGRVLRESYMTTGRSGPVAGETDLDDWKTTAGLSLPFLHKNKQGGEDSSTVQFTSIQLNPTVDPKLFDKPSSEAKATPQ